MNTVQTNRANRVPVRSTGFSARFLAAAVEPLETRRLLANAAQLDPVFADNGIATAAFSSQLYRDNSEQIVVTPQGKTIAIVNTALANKQRGLGVARFNADGSLDTTFGTLGKTTVPIGTDFTLANAVLQTDGKLLVACSTTEFVVVRFNADGTPDNSFGTNGSVHTPFADLDSRFTVIAQQMAVSSNGTVAVGGLLLLPFEGAGRAVRGSALAVYDSSGGLLTSFDSDGRIVNFTGDQSTVILGLTWQPDGKLLVGGTLATPDTETTGLEESVLFRYNINGTLDSTFDSDGKVTAVLRPSLMVIQPDNKILAGGLYTAFGSEFAVARYNANGSLDTTFAGGAGVTSRKNSPRGVLQAMTVTSDGHIRLAGVSHASLDTTIEWFQYSSNGVPDLSFAKWRDNGSFFELASGASTKLPAKMDDAAFGPDGKLVAVGSGFVARVGRDDVALGSNGALWVDGTEGNDTITISPLGASARLVRNGVTSDFNIPVTSIQLALSSGNNKATITVNANSNVQSGSGDDQISTAGGKDTITDSGGNDTLLTGDGNDSVTASGGIDSIDTGAGNDWVLAGSATIAAGSGNDTVSAGGASEVSLGAGDDTAYAFGTISGDDGNDTIHGSDAADNIAGGAGDDSINGNAGNDTINGGDGNDCIEGSFGDDSLYGNANSDTVYGGFGDDRVAGNGGADHLSGGLQGGIVGPDGNDRIYGGAGNDALDGDYYHRYRAWEIKRSGNGTAAFTANPGNDWLDGGAGNDTLMGYGGDDTLVCGGGRDYLGGGDGNDLFDTTDGTPDTLVGGGGTNSGTFDELLDSMTDVAAL